MDKKLQATANYINDVLNQSKIKDFYKETNKLPVKILNKNASTSKYELKSEVFI